MNKKSDDKQQDYFNSLSDQYVEGNDLFVDLLKDIKKLTTKYINGDVLDVGSGGIISFEYKKARTVTLTDIAEELIKSPKVLEGDKFKLVNSKKIKALKASAMKLPFKDKSFDVVMMFNVVHHLSVNKITGSQRNAQKAFKEIHRVLKTGGVFIFVDNFPTLLFKALQELSYEMAYWLLLKLTNKPLPYFLSEQQAKKYLSDVKFEIEDIENMKWPKKIYLPVFPLFSPPGWLWEMVLKNRMYICLKK